MLFNALGHNVINFQILVQNFLFLLRYKLLFIFDAMVNRQSYLLTNLHDAIEIEIVLKLIQF